MIDIIKNPSAIINWEDNWDFNLFCTYFCGFAKWFLKFRISITTFNSLNDSIYEVKIIIF